LSVCGSRLSRGGVFLLLAVIDMGHGSDSGFCPSALLGKPDRFYERGGSHGSIRF
jgi:hypothetical protein